MGRTVETTESSAQSREFKSMSSRQSSSKGLPNALTTSTKLCCFNFDFSS